MSELLHKELSSKIIELAIKVHRNLGPGYPEKIYQRAMYLELKDSPLKFEREKKVMIKYNNIIIGYQILDFIVENKIIIEVKATDYLSDIHAGQMLSYLKATGNKIGLILNFGQNKLEIKRVIN